MSSKRPAITVTAADHAMLSRIAAGAANTMPELLKLLKSSPGKLTFASAGNGTTSHLAGELLKASAGVFMVHIPYRGGGPAVAAAVAGDVPLLIVSIPAAMGQVRSGRLRPLAVSTKKRTPILPNVPTIAEATGLKDYEVDSWYAVFAPAKAPDEAVDTMQKAIAGIATRPDVAAKLLQQGAIGVSSTPDELGKIVKKEIADGFVPVISPVAEGYDGKPYNVNADLVAGRVASALRARRLVYMSDVPGLLSNPPDASSLISTLKISQVDDLKKKGVIDKGMRPKVQSAIRALQEGVQRVHFIDGRLAHSLLLEIFTDKGIGTEIVHG